MNHSCEYVLNSVLVHFKAKCLHDTSICVIPTHIRFTITVNLNNISLNNFISAQGAYYSEYGIFLEDILGCNFWIYYSIHNIIIHQFTCETGICEMVREHIGKRKKQCITSWQWCPKINIFFQHWFCQFLALKRVPHIILVYVRRRGSITKMSNSYQWHRYTRCV